MTRLEPKLRADALRNRRRVLDAAAEVFAERGLDAGMDEVARRAGVGHATVFRRFPTKEALVVELLRDRLQSVLALADAELEQEPGAGVRRFMERAVELQLADRALFDALGRIPVAADLTDLQQQILDRAGALLARAQAAGAVRGDVSATDLAFLASSVAYAGQKCGSCSVDGWRRYLALALDGLRPEAASPLPAPAPTDDEFLQAASHSA